MLASKGNAREAFSKYVGKDFKHHNIYFKGDSESLMIAMEEDVKKNPTKICDIKRVLQDGDWAVTHSHIRQKPEEPGTAVVHIFRFEDDKIAELSDIGQAVPLETVNKNGIF